MSKFGTINTDTALFVGDRTRIDVSKCFVTPDEDQALSFSIKPSAADDFYAVTTGYLDWVYGSSGPVVISVNIANAVGNQTFTKTVQVLDLADAKLFSSDEDLVPYAPEVMIYLPEQWNTFNVLHFRAKQSIMKWLFDQKLRGQECAPLTDADLFDSGEFNGTSTYMVLALIYGGASQQAGDVFSDKSKDFEARARAASAAAVIRLDVNHDGKPEEVDNFSGRLVRV